MTTNDPTGEYQMIEELTAYLDGELDEQAHLAVEARLNEDPQYLAELQSLQHTWDILDQLPKTEPGSSFTKTTMEIVVQEAKQDSRTAFSWLWPARVLTVLASFGALFFLGFACFRMLQGQADWYLVQHLPTIEHHELFEAVNLDIPFLEKMNERGFFSSDEFGSLYLDSEPLLVGSGDSLPAQVDSPKLNADPGVGPAGSGEARLQPSTVFADDLDARYAWIEQLDVVQKAKLKDRFDDFMELAPERRDALIRFGQALKDHPNRSELMTTLQGYFEWLKTVDPRPRSKLMDEPTDERLVMIAKLRASQARAQFGAMDDLSQEDTDLMFGWFRSTIESREQEIREHFVKAVAAARQEDGKVPLPEPLVKRFASRGQLNYLVDYLIEIDRPFIESLVMQEAELELLMTILTPASKRVLQSLDATAQRELIVDWVNRVNQSYYNVPRERLLSFYESLSEDERDQLDQMPLKLHLVKLKELYLQRNPNRAGRMPLDWRRLFETETPFWRSGGR